MPSYPEAELCRHLSAYLQAEGWEVYTEVPLLYSRIDVVARRGDRLHCIEAKTSLTKQLRCQIGHSLLVADLVSVCVATKPVAASLEWAQRVGIGIYRVAAGRVEVLVPARDNARVCQHYREQLTRALANMKPGGEAGLPVLAGCGPAQALYAEVQAYRQAHPGCTWREVYAAVPNYYSSPSSMAGGMRAVENQDWRRELRQRIRAARKARGY